MLLLTRAEPPIFPRFAVHALAVPSQRVDGDPYNFFSAGAKRLDVIVADVMGKASLRLSSRRRPRAGYPGGVVPP